MSPRLHYDPPLEVTDAVLEAMARYGGSFATALAKCYQVADSTNRATLRAAFASVFAQGADLAAASTAAEPGR